MMAPAGAFSNTLGDNWLSSNGCDMEDSQKDMACCEHAVFLRGDRKRTAKGA
jgi:hypothetical protein